MTDAEKAAEQARLDKEAADKIEADRVAALSLDDLRAENANLKQEQAKRRLHGNDLQAKLDQIALDNEAAAKAAAEKSGEFKDLYESLKGESEGTAAKLAALEGTLNKVLEVEILSIPEAHRVILDQFDTVQAKLDFISTARSTKLFDKPEVPGSRIPGELPGKNSIQRAAFDAMPPGDKQKHVMAGGLIHD